MATWYVDVSAAFNGDGTSSAQAASDGAPGAFNDFVAAFEGTPRVGVSLTAGDDVWVRSASGGSDLIADITASVSSTSVGTQAAPITFYIDNLGEVWAGDTGSFWFRNPTTSELTIYCSTGVSFIATAPKGLMLKTNYATNGGTGPFFTLGDNYHKNLCLQTADTTNNVQAYLRYSSGVYENIYLDLRSIYAHTSYPPIDSASAAYDKAKFINLTVDYTNCGSPRSSQHVMMGVGTYSNLVEVDGLTLIGGLENTFLVNLGSGSQVKVKNARVSHFANILPVEYLDMASRQEVMVQGYNGNVLDTIKVSRDGITTWRAAGSFPFLNAVLPTGAGWSYRFEPSPHVAKGFPASMAETTLFHKLADGVRTIRAEILLPNDYGTPNNDDFYMVASYQDTSDIGRTQSSAPPPFGVAPLQAGSAVWTYTALYTDAGYTAWKLELITEHPVKQNTPVFVAVLMTKGRITSADELFVDPAIVIE